MAHARDDSLHRPLRESPLHSRAPSTASDWNGTFDRPTTSDAKGSYRELEYVDSSRAPVFPGTNRTYDGTIPARYDYASLQPSPAQESFGHVDSPTRQAFLPQESNRPASPGFHPGFPRPETPSSPYDPSPKTWPGSPLKVPMNSSHADSNSSLSLKSIYNEYFRTMPREDRISPRKEGARPPGPPGGPPPDGGTTAWLQVLGGYFLFFNTWGLINAFGVRRSASPLDYIR